MRLKLRQPNRVDLALAALQILITLSLIWAWQHPTIPLPILMRDAAAAALVPPKLQPYYGLFSNLGVLFWCAAAGVTLFSAIVARRVKREQEFSAFLLHFGLLTALLTIDDFFLLHEVVFPYFLRIDEEIVYLVYGGLLAYVLLRFRRIILRKTSFQHLLLALFLFGVSTLIDKVLPGVRNGQLWLKAGENYLLEDGIKLLGIATWFFYLTQCSLDGLHRCLQLAGGRQKREGRDIES